MLVVARMLGHSDVKMTLNVYGHLFPDRLDEVVGAMESARTRALTESATDYFLTKVPK
ncbi:hypothetical protein [Rathayibacter agropyri]|uniref:hypothetical protein n=1 Tax=Rathayibacter agropyri TaxID=1634927 RepID=UPI0031B631A9